MTKDKVSVIIPSYKDPLLHKTINSLLTNAGGDIEIIVVLDGYWTEVLDNEMVRVVHLGKNVGMREAINQGIRIASGEYLMRTDEHCMFGDNYDLILKENIKDDWVVTPRRYFLDADNWTVMDIPPVDYMKLKIVGHGKNRKFSGTSWKSRAKRNANKDIDQTAAMQGSCWFMKKVLWDKVIKRLETENYGPHYQDSHEMIFKVWKAGGKLVVNKNTWHAHKHRKFPRTHNNGTKENPSNNEFCFANSLKIWEDYYNNEVLKMWNNFK